MEGLSYNKKSILEKTDTTPTANSTNNVTSGGVKTYVDAADAVLQGEITNLENRLTNPFTYKGSVAATSNLPGSGNTVNDVYFVEAENCLYAWNGSAWGKASTNDYEKILGELAAAFDAAKVYKKGELVLYNDGVYVRKADATQADGSWVAANWTATDLGTEIANVNNALLSMFGFELGTVLPWSIATPAVGSIWDSENPTYNKSNPNYLHCEHDFFEGMVAYFRTRGSSTYRTYMILDASNKVLVQGPTEYKDYKLVAPRDSAKIIINYISSTVSVLDPREFRPIFSKEFLDYVYLAASSNHYLIRRAEYGQVVNLTPEYNETYISRCATASVTPGQVIEYSVLWSSTNFRSIMFLDKENRVIFQTTGSFSGLDHKDCRMIVPEKGTTLVVNWIATQDMGITWNPDTYYVKLYSPQILKGDTKYLGCKISLLGDSISAYENWIPSSHKYYPNPNSDVSSPEQMWWKIVINELELNHLVINAWSGSTVTAGVRSASSYTPASDVSRCQNLHETITTTGGDVKLDPDIILIQMGTNDYSYMSNSEQFGTWDGHTALGTSTDDTLSDYDTSNFRAAYATMLARIQKRYPLAKIFCMTILFTQRNNSNTGVTYLNQIGKTLEDYNNAIREVAAQMLCEVIDVTTLGFHRYNFYPTYAQDSATIATHETIAGQAEIAKCVIQHLKNSYQFPSLQ